MVVTRPTGDVENLTNIGPDDNLRLENYLFPIGRTFLDLVYVPGQTTATITTTKPLDADVLKEVLLPHPTHTHLVHMALD